MMHLGAEAGGTQQQRTDGPPNCFDRMYGFDGSFGAAAGGVQAMTNDVLTVLNDIPFSIPPYFALLGRAVVTLEGIALTGDPNYKIVMEVRAALFGRCRSACCVQDKTRSSSPS